ncbi:Diels-Alderase ffsF [Trichinella pseudospiralis]
MASTQPTQLLNAVKARTEWLDLLKRLHLKEYMHAGKFYDLVEPKGLPGSQYPTDTVVECCEGEDRMVRAMLMDRFQYEQRVVLKFWQRKLIPEDGGAVYVEPKGLPGSQYPSATAVECCEGENGMVRSAKVITAE